MDSNPSRIDPRQADSLASTHRWGPVAIPLAAAMILGMTFLIWMLVLVQS